jgi:hypothetical protein
MASDAAVDVLAKDPEREAAVRSTCPLGLPAVVSRWSVAFGL